MEQSGSNKSKHKNPHTVYILKGKYVSILASDFTISQFRDDLDGLMFILVVDNNNNDTITNNNWRLKWQV